MDGSTGSGAHGNQGHGACHPDGIGFRALARLLSQAAAVPSAHFPKSARRRRGTFSRTSEKLWALAIYGSGAAYDLKSLNPILPRGRQGLQIGGTRHDTESIPTPIIIVSAGVLRSASARRRASMWARRSICGASDCTISAFAPASAPTSTNSTLSSANSARKSSAHRARIPGHPATARCCSRIPTASASKSITFRAGDCSGTSDTGQSLMVRSVERPSRPSESEAAANRPNLDARRTMLRIAGRTMRQESVQLGPSFERLASQASQDEVECVTNGAGLIWHDAKACLQEG
jgi:hypothetical protein